MAYAAIAPLRAAAQRQARTRARPHPVEPQPTPAQLPDWQSDPVLQRIEAQQQAAIAQAQAASIAQRQAAEIGFGYDPNYNYADENTRQAAQQNPFSTLAQLLQAHQRAGTNIDEGYNKQNLFYSGHRGQALGDEAQNYLQNQYAANQGLQRQLTGISSNLLAAQTGGQEAVNQAQSEAYNRGLNFQLQYGGYPATPQVPAARTRLARPRRIGNPSQIPGRYR